MSFLKIFASSAFITAGAGFYSYYRQPFCAQKLADYEKIRESIAEILPQPDYDYGSIAPLLVRLAWHSSGTYLKETRSHGSNGATMRFSPESSDPANKGLDLAQKFLEPIKKKYPEISYADLWILAAYVAIEEMGGPHIPFKPGRVDKNSETDCPPQGRLPDATKNSSHIRDVFHSHMGFTDKETVALIGGGHGIGKCHKERSGFEGPWTKTPLSFTNNFFKELLNNDWKEKKWDGPKQFEDGKGKGIMMLIADLELKKDGEFRKWCEEFAKDEEMFFRVFADAFKKLTELGFVQY